MCYTSNAHGTNIHSIIVRLHIAAHIENRHHRNRGKKGSDLQNGKVTDVRRKKKQKHTHTRTRSRTQNTNETKETNIEYMDEKTKNKNW